MGFKLERSFPVVRENMSDPLSSFENGYVLAWPLFNGLGDVADSSFGGPTPHSKCVGDPGNSPAAGDGIVNTTDAICDLFTDRSTNGNSFAISRFNRDTCQFEPYSAAFSTFQGMSFAGTAFPLDRDAGSWITVNATALPPNVPQNRAVIVGSHDPSYTGRQIRLPIPPPPATDCSPRQDIIAPPYHSMYQKANEILCGLEGLDWVDTLPGPPDGNPDTCTRGIFDGGVGPTHSISVLTFDNVNDGAGQDNGFITRVAKIDAFPPPAHLAFAGTNFDLTPGEAYYVSISPAHVTTTFLSPHF
jgi:hypothetical protein